MNPLFKTFPVDYFTTDCIVEKIWDVNTQETMKWIRGKAWYPFTYKKGERITGTSVYYCKTRAALYSCYLYKGMDGKIKDILTNDGIRQFEHQFCFPMAIKKILEIRKANKGNDVKFTEETNLMFWDFEKAYFPDENRTREELLHEDPLTDEIIPPELQVPGFNGEDLRKLWKAFRERYEH